ncbi:MAG: AAA family ATPase [Opitutaceae bacterium]
MKISEIIGFAREMATSEPEIETKVSLPPIEFRKPSEILAYVPPEGSLMVGDHHIVKGAISVLAGAPGVGKSRAAIALAIAGATGKSWFDLNVHQRFRTAIIQSENGPFRLKKELEAIGIPGLNEFIRISPPPEGSLNFFEPGFILAVREMKEEFCPDLIVIDPWTATVSDDKSKDFRETINQLRFVIGNSDRSPAILIIAHTRKPKSGDLIPQGRSSMHEVAGSYVLTSHSRSVFNLFAAYDDPQDDRVIFINSKNNDGEMAPRSAWHRKNGLFEPCPNFDWQEFEQQHERKGRAMVSLSDIRAIFDGPTKNMRKSKAVPKLMELTGCSNSVAYEALRIDGKFANHLEKVGDFICLRQP